MSNCRTVVVEKLPESVSVNEAHQLFRKLARLLTGDRPCLVFDFSDVRQLDSAGIEVLLRCMEEAMLQPSKDQEVMNRTSEIAPADAEQYLQAGGECVADRLFRERGSQLRDGRHVAVDRGVLASNRQPPS